MGAGISNASNPIAELYKLQGKTLIWRDATSSNNTTTIYEVTAGKTFYLMNAGFAFKATSDAGAAYLVKGEVANLDIIAGSKADITATYKVSHSSSINIPFPVPVPIPSGLAGFIRIQTQGAGSTAFAWIFGWEE